MDFPWAAGWIPRTESMLPGWRPRSGRQVPGVQGVWAAGYEPAEARSAIAREVSVTVVGSCQATDAELDQSLDAARAGRWDELARWAGSYVTIVQRPGETVVFGDLAGVARVYFATTDAGYLWATAATPLAAYLGARRRLDLLALDMAVTGVELYGGDVPYERVHAVPPGHVLRIDRARCATEPWYVPRRFVPDEPPFPEAARQFRDLLADAVARRVASAGSTITGDFSGGLDSSALMCLAARGQRVVGITYADYPGADHAARLIASECPRLQRDVVHRVLHYGELDSLTALPVTDLPSGDLAVLGPDRAILERAASFASSDHLIGVGGDELLTARYSALVTLLRGGRRREALRRALALSRDERIPAARMLLSLRRLAATPYPRALRHVAGIVGSGTADPAVEPEDWQDIAWATPMAAAGWLTPEAARWISGRLLALAQDSCQYETPEALDDWQEIRRGASDIQGYRALARELGITIHTPYYDNELLARFLAMPGYAREPQGFKPLATVGMADLLPPALVNTTSKDDNNVILADELGLQQNADALRAFVSSSVLISEGIFQPFVVSAYVERAIAGVDTRHKSLGRFIAAELWARRSDLRRETWWEEATCTQQPR